MSSVDNQDQAWRVLWDYYPRQKEAAENLLLRLAYRFKEPRLYFEALVHRSAVDRNSPVGKMLQQMGEELPWYERLEFLGDAVLGLIVTTELWRQGAAMTEGQLSKQRSQLVNELTLAELARKIDLDRCIFIGRGEEKSGGRNRDSLMAAVLEAVIGAVYLDGGFTKVQDVVVQLFQPLLAQDLTLLLLEDYKSQLQELTQQYLKQTPHYKTLEEYGPDHNRCFRVAACLDEQELAIGEGSSKKKASQQAAFKSLERVRKELIAENKIEECEL